MHEKCFELFFYSLNSKRLSHIVSMDLTSPRFGIEFSWDLYRVRWAFVSSSMGYLTIKAHQTQHKSQSNSTSWFGVIGTGCRFSGTNYQGNGYKQPVGPVERYGETIKFKNANLSCDFLLFSFTVLFCTKLPGK